MRKFRNCSSNSEDPKIYNIFSVRLSQSKDEKYKKCISIITAQNNNSDEYSTLLDIRFYKNNISTNKGVYLTEKEYNWLVENLRNLTDEKEYTDPSDNPLSVTSFKIIPSDENKVLLTQCYNGRKQKVFLLEHEINTILNMYPSFDKIIDVFERSLISEL